MKYFILLLIATFSALVSEAQFSGVPEIGKRCPSFTLNTIDFYTKKKVSLDDFKGKWLVLDFWSKDCSSCIANFPNINREQKKFKDTLQFVMVSYVEHQKAHRKLYAKYHEGLGLTMPGAIIDSASFFNWTATGLPYSIIIDPNGIIQAITNKISSEKLGELIKGNHPPITDASFAGVKKNEENKLEFDIRRPFAVNGNGGADSDFVFRSLLAKWKPGNPSGATVGNIIYNPWEEQAIAWNSKGRFEMLSFGLKELYMTAYTGRIVLAGSKLEDIFWPKPIFETKDTSEFKSDQANGKNMYSYSMIVPSYKANEAYMMEIMQTDLQHYFGYNAKVEVRKMPYWRLIDFDNGSSKLKSREENGKYKYLSKKPGQGFTCKNLAFHDFVRILKGDLGLSIDTPPLIDETGIKGNIDIDVEWLRTDYTSIRKALNKYGLDLIAGTKEMKVLVIRDNSLQ